MKSIQHVALWLALAAALSMPAVVLAADAPAAAAPVEQKSAAKLEDLSSLGNAPGGMQDRCQNKGVGMSMKGHGAGPMGMMGKCDHPDGEKCNMEKCDKAHGGHGMQGGPMGMMGHGKACHDQAGAGNLEQRVESLEKRIDMMQMMMRKMMRD